MDSSNELQKNCVILAIELLRGSHEDRCGGLERSNPFLLAFVSFLMYTGFSFPETWRAAARCSCFSMGSLLPFFTR